MNPRLRAWSSRTFYDPEPVLRSLRHVELAVAASDTPNLIRRLRTNRLKTEREARDALLFAHGMASVVGAKVLVAPGEIEDCDFITRTTADETDHFACVQLKELAPEDLNATQTLSSFLGKLQRLPTSDAVLAIHLNRRTTIPLEALSSERIAFAEVWYFWAADPSADSWRLYGDAKGQPRMYDFEYPR